MDEKSPFFTHIRKEFRDEQAALALDRLQNKQQIGLGGSTGIPSTCKVVCGSGFIFRWNLPFSKKLWGL